MTDNKHYLIIGVGNTLLSDDGIGIHIIKKMEEEAVLQDAEFLDMGTSSMELGYYINDSISKMVIIDSIRSEEEPGTIFRFRPEDLVSRKKESYSLHQIKLIDTLKLVSLDKDFPDTIIIGIVPYDVKTFSEQLSARISGDFPDIYGRVLKVLMEFLEK